MLVESTTLELQLRDAKAEAHQMKLNAQDREEQRAATFEAGRVAGLAVALRLLELEAARAQGETLARTA